MPSIPHQTPGTARAVAVSVVAPLYNEAGSVRELHERIVRALRPLGRPFEIIFVDDGSRDDTFRLASSLAPLTVLRLRKNFGQTAALAAGIREAGGGVIVTMDGDLENDPADIPVLLETLDRGYDIISGWRRGRWKDQPFSRRLPSWLANKFISLVTGVKLHDHGCQLKAYRRPFLTAVNFSGGMHRMTAAYAAKGGAKVAEIPVRFEKRKHGMSKYGMMRVFWVLLDVLAFHFFHRFSNRPMHFFGAVGFLMAFFAGLSFIAMLVFRFSLGISFIETPLPMLTVFFAIIAVQFILMGLLAEMFRRLRIHPSDASDEIAERVENA